MTNALDKAVKVLKQGGIIIFPTDTAFGIGCRMDDEKAVERLFKIRNRPQTQAVPVLVSSLAMAKNYSDDFSNEVMQKLTAPYWPGALTIVVGCKKDKVPLLVRGGGNTVGFRMPKHKDLLKVIGRVGVPILGPSANFHSEITPFTLGDVDPRLIKMVDYVLNGKCLLKDISTVVDTTFRPWKILRQGALEITIDI